MQQIAAKFMGSQHYTLNYINTFLLLPGKWEPIIFIYFIFTFVFCFFLYIQFYIELNFGQDALQNALFTASNHRLPHQLNHKKCT
jgi:hypothetical protein